jgi:hypothetical protein
MMDGYGSDSTTANHVDEASEVSSNATESDEEEEGYHFKAYEGWVPKPKKVCPAVNGGLPNYAKGDYDTEYWLCKPAGKCGRFINMKDLDHGGEYTVPIARINKALRFLHLPTVAASLRSCAGFCRCKREPKCYQRATTHSVLTHRHTYFQQLDEAGATKFLADMVRSHNISTTSGTEGARPRFKWVIDGKDVCDDFFRGIYGISKDKLKGVRNLLAGERV